MNAFSVLVILTLFTSSLQWNNIANWKLVANAMNSNRSHDTANRIAAAIENIEMIVGKKCINCFRHSVRNTLDCLRRPTFGRVEYLKKHHCVH